MKKLHSEQSEQSEQSDERSHLPEQTEVSLVDVWERQ